MNEYELDENRGENRIFPLIEIEIPLKLMHCKTNEEAINHERVRTACIYW